MDQPWLLVVAVLVTSALSGVFGMGGGMILMGVCVWVLPVREAMVLHGVAQLASNGFRAVLLRRHVHVPVLGWYALGAAVGVASLGAACAVAASSGEGPPGSAAFVPDRRLVLLVLGGLPLLAALLPSRLGLSIESPRLATTCGAVVTAAHLTAGVSGPLLDVFFVRGTLGRREVVATKALTQTAGHLLKLVHFGALVEAGDAALRWWAFPLVVAGALVGTRVGAALLGHLSDVRFRRASRALVLAIALVFVARGLAV